YDKVPGHGHGIIDLPVDRRRSRRTLVSGRRSAPWIDFSHILTDWHHPSLGEAEIIRFGAEPICRAFTTSAFGTKRTSQTDVRFRGVKRTSFRRAEKRK